MAAPVCLRLVQTLVVMNTYRRYKRLRRSVPFLIACWAQNQAVFERDEQRYEEDSWAFGEFSDIARNYPEKCWNCILYALGDLRCHPFLGDLAAGPLEDLLSHHGELVTERVEYIALSSPLFARTLGGVWRSGITEPVWQRVQSAAIPLGNVANDA